MSRHLAREIAFKVIFEIDAGGSSPEKALGRSLESCRMGAKYKEFIRVLVQGVQENKEEIDRTIKKFLTGWSFNRLARVDRSILRLSVFELLWLPDIPPAVTINEALVLVKKFQGEESVAFVNGILDRVMRERAVTERRIT